MNTHLEKPVIPAAGDVPLLPVPAHALKLRAVRDRDLLAQVDEHPACQCFMNLSVLKILQDIKKTSKMFLYNDEL